jgi:hypothetical protein
VRHFEEDRIAGVAPEQHRQAPGAPGNQRGDPRAQLTQPGRKRGIESRPGGLELQTVPLRQGCPPAGRPERRLERVVVSNGGIEQGNDEAIHG